MSDGIEIHFDETRGYLALGCEPDAFAKYRAIAREQLKDFPEIPVDKVIEINLVDTATFVARRDAPRKRIGDLIICGVIIIVVCLAAYGGVVLCGRLIR
jgi:hypothetical protein